MITKIAYELLKEAKSKKEWKKQRAAERSVTQKKKVKPTSPVPPTPTSQPNIAVAHKNIPPTSPVQGASNIRKLAPKVVGGAAAAAAVGGVGHHLYKKHKNRESE